MTDGVAITSGAGTVVATDDVGGVHYQITKLAYGALDSATLVSTANGLPVQITGTVPVTGSFYQAVQPVTFSGGLTLGAGSAAIGAVSVSNFPATQAVSIAAMPTTAVTGPLTDTQLRATAVPVSNASLPLPTGASTETTLAAISTKTPALGQGTMAASSPVTIASNQSALAVTGTFFQATQPVSIAATVAVSGPLTDTQIRATALPVSLASTTITGTAAISAAALPLPSGAATETTLAALNTKVTAVNTGAVTISAALPAGTNALGTVTANRIDTTATGTIAAAAANVALALNGKSGVAIQITGTWVGTLQFEGTLDGTNWVTVNGVYAGASTPGSTITANGIVRLTPSGLAQLRINATAWTSGTATITMRASDATGGTFINQSLTAGTNVIGKVGIDQTTPGTTNLVSIGTGGTVTLAAGAAAVGSVTVTGTTAVSGTVTVGNASLAVTGAFFQATQPVSLTSTTITGSVAVTGPLTDTQIRATALPVSLASTTITGTAAISAASLPLPAGAATETTLAALNTKVTAVNTGAVTISAALPTGANTIGAVNIAAAQSVAVTQATAANLQVTGTPATPTASIITSAASTNATSVKATAGTLYSITVSNAGAAAAFVKLYNTAAAPTVGTTSIALTIPVAASGVVTIPFGPQGMRFGTGIALAITNLVGETDATAVAANQVKVLTSYI